MSSVTARARRRATCSWRSSPAATRRASTTSPATMLTAKTTTINKMTMIQMMALTLMIMRKVKTKMII